MIYGHILGSILAVCAFVLHLINGAGRGSEDRTHAPVTRPGSLASCSLNQLEYPPKYQDALFAYRIRTCYLLSEIQIL